MPGRRRSAPLAVLAVLAVPAGMVATAALALVGPRVAAPRAAAKTRDHGHVVLRAGWDMKRFAKTVSFFRGSPWKLVLPAFMQREDTRARRRQVSEVGHVGSELTIIDWGESDGMPVGETWGQLDDVVMGGVSSSQVFAQGAGAQRRLVFAGTTSKENNGGFCSFRSRVFSPPFNLSSYDGLAFTAKCRDGLRYKVQLRDNTGWDSIGYAGGFKVPVNEEAEIKLPFSALVANFRTKTDPSAGPMERGHLASIQFVLSAFEFDKDMNPHFKEGQFQLELGPIRAYRDAEA